MTRMPKPFSGLGHYVLGGPDGRTPILEESFLEWAKWYETSRDARRVALTEIANVGRISTIFLGLDHQFGNGRPILFETMSYFDEHWGEDYFARYHTWDEAQAGHDEIVRQALARVEKTAAMVADVLVPGEKVKGDET